MATKDEILSRLLKEGNYVSGEELARQTGVSRAAVWKAIKSLKKSGYDIEGVTKCGYKLKQNNSLVTAEGVKALLEKDIEVTHFDTIDSTNTYCKRLLADGKQGEFLVTAAKQTAGRGRQGKSFYSPSETGIYFSLVIRPDTSLQNAVTATTAAAVAVCKAIEKTTDLKPKIKWVNDVYLNGKKVCGILTEATTDFESGTVDSVIIGIGINISTTKFPSDVEGAGCLDVDVNRSALIAQTVNELMKIAGGDYASFIDYYRSHSMVIGEKIKFIQNGETNLATATAIDEKGGLEVELENGEKTVLRSGEITVRKV